MRALSASLHSSTTHPPLSGLQYQIQLPAHLYPIFATAPFACSARVTGSQRARLHVAVAHYFPGLRAIRFPVKATLLHPTVGLPASPLSSQRYDQPPTVLYPLATYRRETLVFVARSLGRWFSCRILPVRFLCDGMPYSDCPLAVLTFVDMRSLSLPG